MSNAFAVLDGFQSNDPSDYQVPKKQSTQPRKPKKKAAPAPIEKKDPITFKKNNRVKARGHGVDRNRVQARRGKTFDRSKPGKIKKGGAGKGNWGKNDGKAPARKFLDKKDGETEEAEKKEETEEVAEEAAEEVVEEVNNTVTYEEYLASHSTSHAKRAKHKIDNSKLDSKLAKTATQVGNQGKPIASKTKRAKNKRRRKGVDLSQFLAAEKVTGGNKSQKKKFTQKAGKQQKGAPNLSNLELFPAL